MSTYQRNIYSEGTLGSNFAVESLNTKIFSDKGTENNIVIDILGIKTNVVNKRIIDNYNQIKDIPIHIKKNGDMGNYTSLTITIDGLTPIPCYYNSKDGLTNVFPENVLKNGAIIKALYNGTYFIIENNSLLAREISKISTDLNSHVSSEMPHIFTQDSKKYKYGFRVDSTGQVYFKYEELI